MALLSGYTKDHRLLRVGDVETTSRILYLVEREAMAEENVSLLSLVVRIYKFVILYFLKFLDLRLQDGICAVGINGFSIDIILQCWLSFLLHFELGSLIDLGLENLARQNIRYFFLLRIWRLLIWIVVELIG